MKNKPAPHMPQKGRKQPANHPWQKPIVDKRKKKRSRRDG